MSLLERKATPYFRFGCIRLFCLLRATLRFDSKLVLIDPGSDDPQSIPKVVRSVALPSPAKGPHGVIEAGDDLWTSCKDSHHVVRINPDHPGDHFVFPCNPRPVFVAIHPTSRDVYATLDQSSEIFRINRSGSAEEQGKTESIPIPADLGSTPVGMIPGPDGNLWFVLLPNSSGGQGRCARILADGDFEWFQNKTGPAAGASLIPARHGVYATELGACAVVHLAPGYSPYGEGINEMANPYSLRGCGVPQTRVDY